MIGNMVRFALPVALLVGLAMGCGDDSGLPDARVSDGQPRGGTFSLSWTLSDEGTAVPCDQIGAVTVTLLLFPKNAGFGFPQTLSCAAGAGRTGAQDPGTYDVEISLGTAGGAVATLPRMRDVVLRDGQDTSLGAVVFEVDASGGLRFRLKATSASSNCGGTGAGGAAIEGVQLALRSLDEVCLPTTFDIAAGAFRPAATFMSTCAAPPAAACIDEDQSISVASLSSGRYDLLIQGLIGGTACWEGGAIVQVPPGGAIKDLGNLSMIRTGATGCPGP
jgi:hypothetical protein